MGIAVEEVNEYATSHADLVIRKDRKSVVAVAKAHNYRRVSIINTRCLNYQHYQITEIFEIKR